MGSLSLLLLLFEVASEVRLEVTDLVAAGLVAAFLAVSGLLAMIVSAGLGRGARSGLLLPVALRDFAVATGIAAAAFGPRSTGALGIYGLLVLLAGTVAARHSSRIDRTSA